MLRRSHYQYWALDGQGARIQRRQRLLQTRGPSVWTLGGADAPARRLIPASPDTDTSPVSGRNGGPASSWTRSQGRGCARPASEGSLDESPSRLDGITANFTRVFAAFRSRSRPQPQAGHVQSRTDNGKMSILYFHAEQVLLEKYQGRPRQFENRLVWSCSRSAAGIRASQHRRWPLIVYHWPSCPARSDLRSR